MLEIGSLGSRSFISNGSRIGSSSKSSGSSGSKAAARVGVRDFMSKLVDAGESLKGLNLKFSTVKAGSARKIKARTVGDSRVELNTSGTKSTLGSSTEISTLTTGVSERTVAWGKTSKSTSVATIHGTYTGTSDQTYEIRSGNTRGWTVGSKKYAFRFYIDGVRQSNISLPGSYTAGDKVSIGDGLEISFGAGAITKRDKLTFDGLTGLDVAADPDEAFDGSTGGYANLDTTVSAGTFEVNGTTITVNDDDTINTVLDSINSSGAGVTAEYDDSTDTVLLTHKTGGANTITVGSDTSGFLAAMKLDTATVSLGQEDERGQAIDQVALFAGMSSGSFEINGVSISVDVTTDTLNDLIDRVNDSEADAVMSYSATTDRLAIRSAKTDEELTVENARRWPTFHPRCGTSFLVFVIIISIGFFAGVFPLIPFPPELAGWKLNVLQASIKIPLMIPIAGISYEVIKYAGKLPKASSAMRWLSWPGALMQKLTTIEPDDDQLEVA